MPDRCLPIEAVLLRWVGAGPEHPRREHPVEQRLHERGVEKAFPAIPLEPDPERLFERRAEPLEGRGFVGRLDPREPVARIGGEEPGEILRLGERGAVGQHTGEVLDEATAHFLCESAGFLQLPMELRRSLCEAERLKGRLPSCRIGADQPKLAQVGDQHQAVASPVAGHLLPGRDLRHVICVGLDLYHAAFRNLPRTGPPPLQLLGRIEPDVRMPRALIGEFGDAEDLGFQAAADGVQQVHERGVGGPLASRAARSALAGEITQVVLDRGGESGVCSGHPEMCSADGTRRTEAGAFSGIAAGFSYHGSSGALRQSAPGP